VHTRLSRRMTCAVAALALSAGAAATPAGAMYPVPEGGGSTKPPVNMELVMRAAQLDPHRSGNQGTLHAKRSVIRVQRRLYRKHFLSQRSYIDGTFGNVTKSAYAAWQRHLGYSGLDASGLPGPTSLERLLGRRYSLTRVVAAGSRVLYDGHTVNARTAAMLNAASHRLGAGCHLGITQGSYNAGGVGASAGTHDGGGAADLDMGRLCGKKARRVVRALRIVGFAAWHRFPIPGVWGEHIHAIAISDPDLAPAAQDQVWDFYTHHDGLAGNGADTGPRVGFNTWERYQRSH
jgi:peptidoglycan hydrolase-like protein with peptidoglycan-binding domain